MKNSSKLKLCPLLLIIFLFNDCSTQAQNSQTEKRQVPYASLFADAVIQRSDKLVYYLTDKAKYGYDFSFLGSAIDQLGSIDKKYSDYMQTYIDYFVQFHKEKVSD
ncbi:hypothetical protein GM418_25825 [Maribellus comscasis]|uniref:Uncharacterized protein n=1 Tax=Maribellus comscasis TaxID=2681766 RepID=A0A6I6K9Z3_9BACT|nr:hypothetical protein [Maribellus comscasis]QGY46954.1 hypothetical protein GM418_25825 [Maribellus comscasis]